MASSCRFRRCSRPAYLAGLCRLHHGVAVEVAVRRAMGTRVSAATVVAADGRTTMTETDGTASTAQDAEQTVTTEARAEGADASASATVTEPSDTGDTAGEDTAGDTGNSGDGDPAEG